MKENFILNIIEKNRIRKTIYLDCTRITILHTYIEIFKQRILIKTLVQALKPLAENITIYGHVDNLALWLVEKCTKEQVCCLVKTINIYIYKILNRIVFLKPTI